MSEKVEVFTSFYNLPSELQSMIGFIDISNRGCWGARIEHDHTSGEWWLIWRRPGSRDDAGRRLLALDSCDGRGRFLRPVGPAPAPAPAATP